MTLFRQQTVDHFLRSSDGAVLQVGRLPYRNFCLFIVFFLLCLLAFLGWERYAQTEVVTGVLIRLAQAKRMQRNRDTALLHRQWSDQQTLLSEAHVSRAVFDEKERNVVEPPAEVYHQDAYVRAA